jgi:hypothetical protein
VDAIQQFVGIEGVVLEHGTPDARAGQGVPAPSYRPRHGGTATKRPAVPWRGAPGAPRKGRPVILASRTGAGLKWKADRTELA